MAKRSRPRKVPLEPPTKEVEELRRWRYRVARARALRDAWAKDYNVEKCEEFFLGKQRPGDDQTSIVLNYFQATIKTALPSLFFSAPKMFVRPKTGHALPIDDEQARIGEGVLEALADHERCLENAMNLALLQAFFRIGAIKIVYDPDMEPTPQAGKPIYATDVTGQPKIDLTRMQPLMGPDGQPVVDPKTGQAVPDPATMEFEAMRGQAGQPLIEPDEVVTDEVYRYQWVNAKNMLLPDEGPDRNTWTWIGEEVCVPLEDAKEDDRFSKRLRDQLVANETVSGERAAQQWNMPGVSKETERLRYFECYDLKKQRLVIFCDGQPFEEFLLNDPLPEGIDDHPYALLLGFTPIIAPKPLPWPHPHTANWLEPQREYNIRRTQTTEGAKRSARKFVYEDGTFDDVDEAVKILQSSKDMEGAKVTDITRPPKVIESPDLNPAIYKDIALLQLDWRTITGQTGARLGNPESDTATEATYVERASNIRETDMRRGVEAWLAEGGLKMFKRVKATLTLDYYVKLRGFSTEEYLKYVQATFRLSPEQIQFLPGVKEVFREHFGATTFRAVTRDDIQFEADVTIAAGSTRPKNLEGERRAFISVLEIFGRAPQLLMSRELTSRVLRMFEMEDGRLLDELTAVAQKMIEVNANQAGRNQGGGAEAAGGGGAGVDLSGLMG